MHVELGLGSRGPRRDVEPGPDHPGLHPPGAVHRLGDRGPDQRGRGGCADVAHHAAPGLGRGGDAEHRCAGVGLAARHDAQHAAGVLVVGRHGHRPERGDVVVVEALARPGRRRPRGRCRRRSAARRPARSGAAGAPAWATEKVTVSSAKTPSGSSSPPIGSCPDGRSTAMTCAVSESADQPAERPVGQARTRADAEDAVEHDVGLAQPARVGREHHTGRLGGRAGPLVDVVVVHRNGVPAGLGEAGHGVQRVGAVVARPDEQPRRPRPPLSSSRAAATPARPLDGALPSAHRRRGSPSAARSAAYTASVDQASITTRAPPRRRRPTRCRRRGTGTGAAR